MGPASFFFDVRCVLSLSFAGGESDWPPSTDEGSSLEGWKSDITLSATKAIGAHVKDDALSHEAQGPM